MVEQKEPYAYDKLIANTLRLYREAYLAGLDEDLRIVQIKLELAFLQENRKANLGGEKSTSS